MAQPAPGGGGGGETTYSPLDSWSFNDTNGWTSDLGDQPVFFTNITGAFFGDYTSVIVDSTNAAWLQYNIVDATATNLDLGQGSIYFWFAPAWTSTNQGGTGAGVCGRFFEMGTYTNDASLGWWSLYEDSAGDNIYFTVQPGDGSTTTYLQAPISWTSNYWHCVTLTYCATNTALYLDGALATNGPGITAWPGTNVQAGGFSIGSDGSTGLLQASGAFDDVYTYNVPLDSDTVNLMYKDFYPDYYLTPENWFYVAAIVSAPSNPSISSATPDVITGQGDLLILVPNISPCISATTNQVWFTNVTATVASDGTMGIIFTIEGGLPNVPYDVFANSVLSFGTNGVPWAWMGQGYQCNTYMLTNLPSTDCFLILGTPQDSSGSGLTDAYQLLVSKTNPYVTNSDLDGVPTGWEILLGLNPTISNFTSPSQRSNYGYTSADWLNGVSGIRSGTIITDNEGNVQSVSQ
jgi:hypothetical protein